MKGYQMFITDINYPAHACSQQGYVIGRGVGIYMSAKVQFDLLKYTYFQNFILAAEGFP
jgi:hypothetical protein